jgi:hypothetical protein
VGRSGKELLPWNWTESLLVFRVLLEDAAADLSAAELPHFNSFVPDLAFTIGDSQEGLQRMLASAGMAELVEQKRGFIRWLLETEKANRRQEEFEEGFR